MIVKQYEAIVERRRHVQASLLPAFEEIAQICLKLARGGQGSINSLQSYLDGTIIIGGSPRSRRSLLLTIHDMAQDREAPLALQRKALAQLIMLQMNPIPKLTLYRDLATVLLRMEAFMRQSAAQAVKEAKRQPLHSFANMLQWEDLRERYHSTVEAVSVGLNGLRDTLPVLQAPRLPVIQVPRLPGFHLPRLSELTLSGLRYASSLRAVISL